MPQTADQVKNIVKAYLMVLSEMGIHAQKAYLFGSQAKGTADSYSDIDLIIVSSAFVDMPLWKRWEILGNALAEILEPIEARGYTPEEIDYAKSQKASFLHEVLTAPETIEYHL